MKRQRDVLGAILAIAALAIGQDPIKERVDVKVIAPTEDVQVFEVDDLNLDLADVDVIAPLEGAMRSLILGVEGQDADEKGDRKVKKQDDGTIVKEIDLGDGRKMKIVITTEGAKHGEKHDLLHRVRTFGLSGPDGKLKTFAGPTPHVWAQEFGVEAKELGEGVRQHMERALRAFDRARDEFIRAYKEEGGGELKVRVLEPGKAPVIARRAPRGAVEAKSPEAERKEKVEDIKQNIEREIKNKVEREMKKAKPGEVQFVEVSPGGAAKQAREIDQLRKEIRELEKMVHDLKKGLERQKDDE